MQGIAPFSALSAIHTSNSSANSIASSLWAGSLRSSSLSSCSSSPIDSVMLGLDDLSFMMIIGKK